MPPRMLPPPKPDGKIAKERDMFEALQRVQSLADSLGMKYSIQIRGNGKEISITSE